MTQRFVISPISLQVLRDLAEGIPTIDLIKNKSVLVIANPSWWVFNEAEIINWCNSSLTSWSRQGMILGFINDEERDLFLMRWS
jgi:hypothetical protein